MSCLTSRTSRQERACRPPPLPTGHLKPIALPCATFLTSSSLGSDVFWVGCGSAWRGRDGTGRVQVNIGLDFINDSVATSASGGDSSPPRQHPRATARGVDTGAMVQTAPSLREAVMAVVELLHSSQRSSWRRRRTGALPATHTRCTSAPPASLLPEAGGARGVGAIQAGATEAL